MSVQTEQQGVAPARLGPVGPSESRASPATNLLLFVLAPPAFLILGAVYLIFGPIGPAVVLAMLASALVLHRPERGVWMGPGLLIVLVTVLPFTEPEIGGPTPVEFFYWAAGLSLVTAATVVASFFAPGRSRATPHRPASLIPVWAFIAVGVLAAAYGALRGNALAVIAREMVGFSTFVLYFAFATRFTHSFSEVARSIASLRFITLASCVVYSARLLPASLSGTYVRERNPLLFYAGAVCVILFAELFCGAAKGARKLLVVGQIVLVVGTVLIGGGRGVLGSSILAVGIVYFLKDRRGRIQRLIAVALVLACLYPFRDTIVEKVYRLDMGVPGQIAWRFVAPWEQDASYRSRMSQAETVVRLVHENPVLGTGMGGRLEWEGAWTGIMTTSFIDNGWAYLALKCGLLGILSLVWTIAASAWFFWKHFLSTNTRSCTWFHIAIFGLMLYYVTSMIFGPSYLHFTTSALAGVVTAYICLLPGLDTSAQETDSVPRRTRAGVRIRHGPF